MPRDDLSIDFVKKMAPSAEVHDPAAILEDFIHRTANLPEEIRFMQDEIADKDRTYNECVKTIEECDAKIQRFIRMNGSHTTNPREQTLRDTIRENYSKADKLAEEKILLSQKAQNLVDKHLRHLDLQIKQLSDRNEPGFTDPDEIPSLIRPSAANNSNTSLRVLAVSTAQSAPLNLITNNAVPVGSRATNPQIRTTQSQTHISNSAPTSPAASMIMNNRNQRESSAGPGGGAPKRGPRVSSGLGSLPTASSGLARHSSLGPGTPKPGTPGATARAGSAGPRANSRAATVGVGRKGTPSAGVGRKKPPSSKSTLSRVKRAGVSKGSPASTADSELSDAESVRSSRAGSRAGSGTPVPRPHTHHHRSKHPRADGDEEMADRGSVSGGSGGSDEEEDEEGKKYCLCQHVSYGDMVACDNPACPYEWFHWSCVGLKSEPEGRWYCPSCSETMKKKGK
ncbi:inhibitor of growth proteins N-terminal histone-binding-domain-containing protein [Hypomontagnella submonticulosa]|nr:inhibitor of growth proteins N-terminal histone-binding-domain-containing protein [Hypomontagnella submonticulosa]